MHVPNRQRALERRKRRIALWLEHLETRELLSFTLIHHTDVAPSGTVAALAARNAAQAADTTTATPLSGDKTGTLTPQEIRRQTLVARFKGNYTTGPGRTTTQALQLTSLGYGGSNQNIHLWTNMRLTVSTDPTQPTTGVIYVIPWNVGTTGTQLFLDLTAAPHSPTFNGIATQYTWTVDPASSGIYTNAAGYGTGSGTLNIQFFKPSPGKFGVQNGKMNFAINGLIDTSGNFNILGVLGNIPNGS